MEILDPKPEQEAQRPNTPLNGQSKVGVVVGVLFIIAGLIFGLHHVGIISYEWRHILLSWPMVLIALAAIAFSKRQPAPGIILLVVGGIFLMPRMAKVFPDLRWLSTWNMHNLWPLVLVAVGLVIIIASRQKKQDGASSEKRDWRGSGYTSKNGRIDVEYVMSGSDQVFMEPVFRGGKISTVFGGTSLDLRRTSLPEGETYLDIECVFGGVTIIVPDTWFVEVHSDSVFGAFNDKRTYYDSNAQDKKSILIIKAECVFGGGELK